MHSAALLPLLAGLAAAAPVATTDIPTNPTPDALPLDFLASVEIPTYSTLEGVSSQDVPYATPTAIAAVAAAQSETPLSVFPAATTVAMNAAGDGADSAAASPTATAAKRDAGYFQRRAACDAQATIDNKYSIDVSSAGAFRASTKIADTAKAAKSPSGYYNNFVNLAGANSAYAYMGYTVVDSGYDVDFCASQCDNKDGCLAFNIYFERDPTIEPGTGCTDPPAFANIKCSFWGSALDATTATNTGQWRAGFEVAIAGSNAYTSNTIARKIDGWSDPLDLGKAVMQAPLYDAAETWTYMGYKLFQDGPYDVELCAAACDAQTQYNIAHPPSSGYTPLCAAFGTYQLTVTDRNTGKSSVVGQMCTMYTSVWDAKYATNTVAWNDAIMTKYTYSLSFFYSKPELQPVTSSDLAGLQQEGQFCTSYLGYVAPTTTATTTVTPPVSTISSIATLTETSTVYTRTVTATTGSGFGKRQDGSSDDAIIVSIVTASSDLIPAPTMAGTNSTLAKRTVVATPTAVSGWSALKISAACSRVATGTVTVTSTTTLPSSSVTVSASTTTTKTISTATTVSVARPSETLIASGRDSTYNYQQAVITLPFSVSGFGLSNNQVSLDRNGWMCFTNPWVNYADWDLLRLYYQIFYATDIKITQGTDQYIKASIAGATGSRSVTFEWYVGSQSNANGIYHFSLTVYEDKPGVIVPKYYQMYNNGKNGFASMPGYIWGIGYELNGKQNPFHCSGFNLEYESIWTDYSNPYRGRARTLEHYPSTSTGITSGLMVTISANENRVTAGTFTP
ncbi:hypothetical protein SLS56_009680 [Neofusicoccum ribis]|uniref:Carbohydrate-binding-like protein n=1 Tax=Neofusicoccum ribis TaxID=45134 RepID=A0ABR3SH21_9PEZI